MDTISLEQIPPHIAAGLEPFGPCFASPRTRRHLPVYIGGLLSDLPRKSARAIALDAGVPPRTIEEFVALSRWDHSHLRNRLQRLVARDHGGPGSIALIGDKATPKRAVRTPGVHRHWSEAESRYLRGLATIHLGYSADGLAGFLDGRLFVPPSRDDEQASGRHPDLPPYRARWQIALEMLDIARENGIGPEWAACGEDYARSPEFVAGLAGRGMRLLGRLSSNTTCWVIVPEGADGPDDLTLTGFHALAKQFPLKCYCWARPLRDILERHPALCRQPWKTCQVEGGGSEVSEWAVRRARCMLLSDRNGFRLPAMELIVYRRATAWMGATFVVTDDTSVSTATIIQAAERARRAAWVLDETWNRLGMGHYTGGSCRGLQRHLALGTLASWLLARPGEPISEGQSAWPSPTTAGQRDQVAEKD